MAIGVSASESVDYSTGAFTVSLPMGWSFYDGQPAGTVRWIALRNPFLDSLLS